ncbi:hypothetical protein [Chromobacterium phragmitis]|uniref:Uncharacterized protein n=1 Tax=Chromobacterium phragmitis TaxID=2202141 RepID=A0A344UPG9_9NEIS|nr:hypothetical protein [Chromobacterium phragmitis]AXE37167.1 hypothetical protein DK843_22730 [Chromobacterium phragmitis]
MDYVDLVVNGLQAASMVIAGASAVAALTPSKRDDEVVGKIRGTVDKVRNVADVLALNIFHAKRK